MDFVIPVALGKLLAERYILTAAELNDTGRKRWLRSQCERLDGKQVSRGVRIDVPYWVKNVVF